MLEMHFQRLIHTLLFHLIQNQIHAISNVPDSDHISSQDILEKARQTEETTQEMSVIVNHNKENALEINNIVERFS